jgi:hypothetical protein
MPNWCDNVVVIKGDRQSIKTVKETLQEAGNVFSFNGVSECPPALLHTSAPNRNEQSAEFNTKKYGSKDWYDWCNSNWGTKWNASDAHITMTDDDQVAYAFQTAWAPPIPVYEKLAKMFPNINIFINYDESGSDFSGWRYYKNGELSKEVEYNESFYGRRAFMEPDLDIWEWLE